MIKTHFSENFLNDGTEKLRAIAHPIRICIIDLLHRNKKMTVTEIFDQLKIDQAVASHHLRIMKSQGIVEVRREGKNSIYALSSADYFTVIEVLTKVV